MEGLNRWRDVSTVVEAVEAWSFRLELVIDEFDFDGLLGGRGGVVEWWRWMWCCGAGSSGMGLDEVEWVRSNRVGDGQLGACLLG